MRTKGLTEEQLAALRHKLPVRARLAVDIMCETGLRISDVLALQPRDLKHTVNIREIKTGTVRTVHISPLLLRRARRYWRRHRRETVIPYDRSTIYRDIRQAADELGFEHISAHSCRKLYARRLRNAGMTAEEVQREMGHKSLGCTMFYLHDI